MKTHRIAKPKEIPKSSSISKPKDPNRVLKTGVWIYFFLWVFEGALRKWIVPELSMPLLVVRDPIVLWLIIAASKRGLLKSNIYFTGMIGLGFFSLFTAIFMGHGDVYTAIYGARTMILYFSMIFVIGGVFNRQDLIKLGKVILWIALPMTFLLVLQFYSPQSAWVNRGVGGDENGAGFGGALGYFRPPGTFSFTNGTTCFYSLLAPFLLYFWLNLKGVNRTLLIAATAALVIAIPISISRALFFQVAVSIAFVLIAISRNPKYFSKVLLATALVIVALALFSNIEFFNTATSAFSSRFESANETEGGLEGVLGNRFFGALIKGVTSSESLFGYGVGSGTPLGALLLNYTKIVETSDFEWMREVAEMGAMGIILIVFRVGLALKLTLASFRKLKNDDMLPWILTSVGAVIVTQGQWHQPTSLGFCALVGGVWLASLRHKRVEKPIRKKKKNPAAADPAVNALNPEAIG